MGRRGGPVVVIVVLAERVVVVDEEHFAEFDCDFDGRQRRSCGVAVVAIARTGVEDGAVLRTDDAAVTHHRAAADVESLSLVRTAVHPGRDAPVFLAGDDDNLVFGAVSVLDGESQGATFGHLVDAREMCSCRHGRPFGRVRETPDGIASGGHPNSRRTDRWANGFCLPRPSPETMRDTDLVAEKVAAAREAVAAADADCWLVFARETTEIPEPALPFVLGFDVVWSTAVLVTSDRSVAILGRHDAPNARELGVHDVRPYDESIAEVLRDTLAEIDPERIAIDVSEDDTVADGLTHGMYRRLEGMLADTPYEDAFVDAEGVVSRVRGRKSETEYERIATAAEETERLLAAAVDAWTPEWTEAAFSEFLHGRLEELGYGTAWSYDYCPTVHAGGGAPVGHTLPGDRTVPEGEVLHVDFGVTVEEYAADIQRLYYHPGEPGESVPDDLQSAYEDVRAAIDAGAAVLEPGVEGRTVDAAARQELTDRGRPAFQHAFGHQVGRNAHDGGTLLGPEWDRYGGLPRREVGVDEVYTMELGVETDWGYLGQEEMVGITEDGFEFVVDPQTELRRLDPRGD